MAVIGPWLQYKYWVFPEKTQFIEHAIELVQFSWLLRFSKGRRLVIDEYQINRQRRSSQLIATNLKRYDEVTAIEKSVPVPVAFRSMTRRIDPDHVGKRPRPGFKSENPL